MAAPWQQQLPWPFALLPLALLTWHVAAPAFLSRAEASASHLFGTAEWLLWSDPLPFSALSAPLPAALKVWLRMRKSLRP
jgi:hypothetical protein